MKIAVIGAGHVGLVSGTCLAETGHHVVCVDLDDEKLALLTQGKSPIYEPGLADMLVRNQRAKRLSFTEDTAAAVAGADVVFFAVGTPSGEDGSTDLQYLFAAAETTVAALTKRCVLVTKSTVPVGTTRKLYGRLKTKTSQTFDLVSNPEFLKEGEAVNDFMKPDRVVVGCESDHARQVMQGLYEPFVRTANPIMFMTLESAEMTKYAANAFLATKISFMNEIAALARVSGADIDVVRKGMGFDRRIGQLFMFPGVGYGGSCFPKDMKSLIALGREKQVPTAVLEAVEKVNEAQKRLLVDAVVRRFGSDLTGKIVAVWGLAFKPNTDDVREAPALAIIDGLLARGASVRVTDPVALEHGRALYAGKDVVFSEDDYATVEGADAWLVVTEWSEFRRPDFQRIRGLMRTPFVLDGRNIYEPEAMRTLGFDYQGIGNTLAIRATPTTA